jgi:hypothetical protein
MSRSKSGQQYGAHGLVVLMAVVSFSFLALEPGSAFVRTMFSNGAAVFWPDAQTSVNLRFGCPQGQPLASWGPCWDDAAADALNRWNAVAARFRFTRQTPASAADSCSHSDTINTASFAPSICGMGFGSALALTIVSGFDDGTLADADVLVDAGRVWATYPGPLQRNSGGAVTAYDFHRVVMHEFGHVLGLAHPDDHGQDVVALMNSHVSDIDDVQTDDINGVNAIYPAFPIATPTALLEDPQSGAVQSGLSIIRGWVCAANRIDLQIDGTSFQAAYPTSRPDTQQVCGTSNTGFSFLLNWNQLGDGSHTVVALRDGVEFGRATVTVVTLGQAFLTGASGQYVLPDFPTAGRNVVVEWRESLQNFVIVGVQ